MKYRFAIAIAIAALLAIPAVAGAAPATVQLRVEGLTETIFEGPVTTDGKTIDKGGTVAPCGNDDPANPVPTMTTSLEDSGLDWDADYYGDFFVNRVGPDASDFVNNRYWGIALNRVPSSVGGCQQQVTDGDEVLVAYDFFRPDFSNKSLLKLEGPQIAEVGKPATVSVSEVECTDYTCAATTSAPAVGATVGGQAVAADGTAQLSLDAGTAHLKAEKAGAIRSNALDVCVHVAGDGNCENLPPKPGTKVKDSSVPVASIAGVANGAKLRRGPKLFKGKVSDAGSSGLKVVKLSLRRHKGGRCAWWSASAERFSGGSCKRKVFFAIGNKADWSYQLAKALGPGHYVLDVKAVDNAGNRGDSFVRGRSRIVFDVTGGTRSARASKRKASGAKTDVMVADESNETITSQTIGAKATTVRASGKRCRVGASTPLAALLAVLGSGRSDVSIKDFGACSRRSARDSGQLFVRSIFGTPNKGADGWVYKLRDKVPSLGGADPQARVKSGDSLVWFYCKHDAAGRCQPTLKVEAPRRVASGSPINLRVVKVDDDGHTTPAPGATVVDPDGGALTTAGDGTLTINVSNVGRIYFAATLPGAVPSIARPVTVGVPLS